MNSLFFITEIHQTPQSAGKKGVLLKHAVRFHPPHQHLPRPNLLVRVVIQNAPNQVLLKTEVMEAAENERRQEKQGQRGKNSANYEA